MLDIVSNTFNLRSIDKVSWTDCFSYHIIIIFAWWYFETQPSQYPGALPNLRKPFSMIYIVKNVVHTHSVEKLCLLHCSNIFKRVRWSLSGTNNFSRADWVSCEICFWFVKKCLVLTNIETPDNLFLKHPKSLPVMIILAKVGSIGNSAILLPNGAKLPKHPTHLKSKVDTLRL